ncbi:MAG: periplasmic heavy metal sensor [Bacteroidota bacterium]
MSKRIIVYAALILTVVNVAVLGTILYNRWSEPSAPCPAETPGQGFEQMKSELSLSPEQIASLQEYRTLFHAELDSLSAQLAAVRTQLLKELWQEEPERARISQIVDQIGVLQSSAQRKVIDHLLSVKGILTPEQQQKFYAIVLQRFASASDQQMPGRRQR